MLLEILKQVGIYTLLGIIADLPGYFLLPFLIKKGLVGHYSPLIWLFTSVGLSIIWSFLIPTTGEWWIVIFIILLLSNISFPLRSGWLI